MWRVASAAFESSRLEKARPVSSGPVESRLAPLVGHWGSPVPLRRLQRTAPASYTRCPSCIKGATVSTFQEANKVLKLALNGMDLKLRYDSGPFNFQQLGVLTASDASFAGESGSKSQQKRIHISSTCTSAPRS